MQQLHNIGLLLVTSLCT